MAAHRHDMKKFASILLGCVVGLHLALAAAPSESDQKWLQAVTKMVTNGRTEFSTPDEHRVALLKNWATEKGYVVEVMKTDGSFHLVVAHQVAQR